MNELNSRSVLGSQVFGQASRESFDQGEGLWLLGRLAERADFTWYRAGGFGGAKKHCHSTPKFRSFYNSVVGIGDR